MRAVNREAWAMYRFGADRWYLRAGQMYLAYGLRLQDQQAFIRQLSGINMDTPDNGMELGYRAGAWDAQLAVSNGAAGGAESDNGKQYTGQVVRLQDRWRVGVGANYNDSSAQRSTSACSVRRIANRARELAGRGGRGQYAAQRPDRTAPGGGTPGSRLAGAAWRQS